MVNSAFSTVFKEIINQATSNELEQSIYVFPWDFPLRSIVYTRLHLSRRGCINEERVASFSTVAEDLKIEGLSNIEISFREGIKDDIESSENIHFSSYSNKTKKNPINENSNFHETHLPTSHREIKIQYGDKL